MCQICQVTTETISNPSLLATIVAHAGAGFLILYSWLLIAFPKKLKILTSKLELNKLIILSAILLIGNLVLLHVLKFNYVDTIWLNYAIVTLGIVLWVFFTLFIFVKITRKNHLLENIIFIFLFLLLLIFQPAIQAQNILGTINAFLYIGSYNFSLLFCPNINHVCSIYFGPVVWLIHIFYYQFIIFTLVLIYQSVKILIENNKKVSRK